MLDNTATKKQRKFLQEQEAYDLLKETSQEVEIKDDSQYLDSILLTDFEDLPEEIHSVLIKEGENTVSIEKLATYLTSSNKNFRAVMTYMYKVGDERFSKYSFQFLGIHNLDSTQNFFVMTKYLMVEHCQQKIFTLDLTDWIYGYITSLARKPMDLQTVFNKDKFIFGFQRSESPESYFKDQSHGFITTRTAPFDRPKISLNINYKVYKERLLWPDLHRCQPFRYAETGWRGIDPELLLVPSWKQNFNLSNQPYFNISNIIKILEIFEPSFPQLMRSTPNVKRRSSITIDIRWRSMQSLFLNLTGNFEKEVRELSKRSLKNYGLLPVRQLLCIMPHISRIRTKILPVVHFDIGVDQVISNFQENIFQPSLKIQTFISNDFQITSEMASPSLDNLYEIATQEQITCQSIMENSQTALGMKAEVINNEEDASPLIEKNFPIEETINLVLNAIKAICNGVMYNLFGIGVSPLSEDHSIEFEGGLTFPDVLSDDINEDSQIAMEFLPKVLKMPSIDELP